MLLLTRDHTNSASCFNLEDRGTINQILRLQILCVYLLLLYTSLYILQLLLKGTMFNCQTQNQTKQQLGYSK